MGVLDLLALLEQASQFVLGYWEQAKEHARTYLGPSSHINYLIFDNDEVIPEGKQHCKYAHAAKYVQAEQRIHGDSTSPHKRLPWLSIQHVIGDHAIDLSDWIAEIRSNTSISLLAILRLASHVQNLHLPEHYHAKVLVVTRNGEEEEYKYHGGTKLLQRIEPIPVEMRHRPTCPYDNPLFF